MQEFSVHLPINGVSLGQCSYNILFELFKRGLNPCIFPIGQIDLSCYKKNDDFQKWLQDNINKAHFNHNRKNPIFKLWHLEGSLESFSEKQVLLTFYELDSPTKFELNVARNNSKVIVTNRYTQKVFENLGLDNVNTVPLGFDKNHFFVTGKKYFSDDRITFTLTGKFEHRKHHKKIIRAWVKKYGNNPNIFLQCAIYNPFLVERRPDGTIVDHNQALINDAVEGKKYFNVNFFGFMAQNELYNEWLNSGDIVLACSGAEGFGLPEFQSVALGKHAVTLNAHGYKEWVNQKNSVIINPCGKLESHDGIFFKKGSHINQGSIFDFDDDEFIAGCEEAIKRVENNRVNVTGLELQTQFTWEKTVDGVLSQLNSL